MTAPNRARAWLGSIAWLISSAILADTGSVGSASEAQVDHDDGYIYRLPYADSVSYSVLQAYGSRLSHRGPEYYTVDFGMPEGTPVYSAREGTVVGIEDRFDQSCWQADCDQYANYVEIRHPDGTLGRYFHLQQGSVTVEPGQWINRGEPIARSGDTGFSNVPHLHFGVYQATRDGVEQSIAVQFAVRGGLIGDLRAGARYINRPE